MKLNAAQRDRAAGVLVATAAGDALGAGYEFGPWLPFDQPVHMNGGGSFGWAPGEWTDDTSMAIAIAQVAADGADLRTKHAQDRIAAAWAAWAGEAKDVGVQTSAVLRAARAVGPIDAAGLRAAADAHHHQLGRSGGNGSLMRTAPVALAYLNDEHALVGAATEISRLTHHDPDAAQACVLWCLAIRHGVLTGELDLRRGLTLLDPDSAAAWAERIDEAEANPPHHFERNGWVVQAFQGAWSAIHGTTIPVDDPQRISFPAQHLQLALENAVRGGRDTTRSRLLPVACSARRGVPARFPSPGDGSCMAGPGCAPATLSRWVRASSGRSPSTVSTRRTCPRSRSTRTTRVC